MENWFEKIFFYNQCLLSSGYPMTMLQTNYRRNIISLNPVSIISINNDGNIGHKKNYNFRELYSFKYIFKS